MSVWRQCGLSGYVYCVILGGEWVAVCSTIISLHTTTKWNMFRKRAQASFLTNKKYNERRGRVCLRVELAEMAD